MTVGDKVAVNTKGVEVVRNHERKGKEGGNKNGLKNLNVKE